MKYLNYLLSPLFFFYTTGSAQSISSPQTPKLENVKNLQIGDKLHFEMEILAGEFGIGSDEFLILTPLISNKYEEKELPPVYLAGSRRYKSEKKAARMNRSSIRSTEVKKNSSLVIHYQEIVEFEAWMRKAEIILQTERYGKNPFETIRRTDSLTCVVLTDGNLSEREKELERLKENNPGFPLIHTPALKTITWKFPIGTTEVVEDSRFRSLAGRANYGPPGANFVESVILEGYTCLEGLTENNEKLARARSFALKDYLQKEYNYDPELIVVRSKGEDWNGLEQLVKESDLPDKQAILDILQSPESPAIKKQRLKKLKDGAIYKQMASDFFPQLDRVDTRIYYDNVVLMIYD